jgi:hypothetical protein
MEKKWTDLREQETGKTGQRPNQSQQTLTPASLFLE